MEKESLEKEFFEKDLEKYMEILLKWLFKKLKIFY